MSMMGLELASVGNREFDEGKDELLRMQNGGCHPLDRCLVSVGRSSGASGIGELRPRALSLRPKTPICRG
jgi:hypothetical protein